MASLVEIQDYKLNQKIAMALPECCDIKTFEEIIELSGKMEPLPTPPLSPDHPCSEGSPVSQAELDECIEVGEALLTQMMACEQLLNMDQAVNQTMTPTMSMPFIPEEINCEVLKAGTDLLLQDCMWNSHAYEPRNSISSNGVYTPAPSPPPQANQQQSNNLSGEEDDPASAVSSSGDCTSSSDEPSDPTETECISPSDVFPVYSFLSEQQGSSSGDQLDDEEEEQVYRSRPPVKRVKLERSAMTTRRTASLSSANSRLHPQATSSESEEEIDVVTISDRPSTRMNTRKRTMSSLSAPCSRQTSPVPSSPSKKRKCHGKRIQRLDSVGSNYGDGTESDDEQRRASHNVLERKRRNDLKFSFQVLRSQIPELEDNQRAPKVTILRKAAEYIQQIQEEDDEMQARFAKEKKREARLRQRLAYLKTL